MSTISTTRSIRITSIASATLLAALALSGCSAGAKDCGTGASSPKAAMSGLIDAAQSKNAVDEACKYIDSDYSYDSDDIDALKSQFPDGSSKVDITTGKSVDGGKQVLAAQGGFSANYIAVKNSDGKWVLEVGTKKKSGK